MGYPMLMTRIKKPVSFALDPKLLARLEAWLAKQDVAHSKTAVLEAALRDWLDRREKR